MARRSVLRGVLVGAPLIAIAGAVVVFGLGPAGRAEAPPRPEPQPSATAIRPTSASPTSPPSPVEAPRRAIVIQGVGDVSLDPRYLPVLVAEGWDWPWAGLEGVFAGDDLTVVNLECPATTVVAPVEKPFNFRCDPLALPAMREAGVDVASQANNHAFDQGAEGLLDSLVQLRAAGILPVGAGRDLDAAMAPAIAEVGGWRIAVVGIGQVIDPWWMTATAERPGTTNGHDAEQVLEAIRRAASDADLVVVAIHWGIERELAPSDAQVDLARRMVEAGADVIFGHHAHRLQRLATVEGRPVFYGLGNFVWPRLSVAGATTAIGRVLVRPDGSIEAALVPVTIVANGRPVLDPAA